MIRKLYRRHVYFLRKYEQPEWAFVTCAGYPYLGIFLFVPCAVLAALGIWVPFTASIMTLDMLWNSSELFWNQM